ncbi:hypothetical protein CtesDRAFT_PD0877 [Comamonas testosteroni KF-1]|uniref:Uncharacterized protein n=1 Tax=Comamonas testosteroni (strain DSM 14576 / KF-1) TaxID=399795 RepID=B7WXA8_COMTK|nr:hypothetical protein CtesDRAFT_PD0877 [Comamonas testosteroni KF-1]
MDNDVLKNAVFEVEKRSMDTRSFLKHIQTGLA